MVHVLLYPLKVRFAIPDNPVSVIYVVKLDGEIAKFAVAMTILLSSLSVSSSYLVPCYAGSGTAHHKIAVTRNTRLGGLGTSGLKPGMATPRAMAFRLCSQFVNSEGRGSKPRFGFNGLGELVYQRTYARYLGDDNDEREQW